MEETKVMDTVSEELEETTPEVVEKTAKEKKEPDEPAWVTKYYKELDREERGYILEDGIKEEGLTKENEFRRKLFEARYTPNQGEPEGIDHFIRAWLNVSFLKEINPAKPKGQKKLEKAMAEIKADLCQELAAEYGEMGEAMLFREIKHAAHLYLFLCKKDRNFSTFLWGFGKLKEPTLMNKIAKVIYNVGYVIPKEAGVDQELAFFTKAISEAYYEYCPKRSYKKLLKGRISGEIKDKGRR